MSQILLLKKTTRRSLHSPVQYREQNLSDLDQMVYGVVSCRPDDALYSSRLTGPVSRLTFDYVPASDFQVIYFGPEKRNITLAAIAKWLKDMGKDVPAVELHFENLEIRPDDAAQRYALPVTLFKRAQGASFSASLDC